MIPLQDEEATIVPLLESVRAQTRPPAELVLVDAGSRDATAERAGSVELPCAVQIVKVERVFPGTARNQGVGAATGEWLAFTDAGVILDRDWLSELADRAGAGVDMVWGGYDPVCDSFFRKCAAVAFVAPRNEQGIRGPSVASCLVRRSAFDAVGGFPPHRAAEDLIFMSRLKQAGFRAAVAAKAFVHWEIADTPAALFRRFASYSYHNLLAGWGRHWHLGTAKLYLLLACAIGVALWAGMGVWSALLPPAFWLARAGKAAWRKRASFEFATLRPGKILCAAAILAVIDAATAAGAARWWLRRIRA